MDANKILWLKETDSDRWHGFTFGSCHVYTVEKMEDEGDGWRVVLHKINAGDVDILPEGSSVQDGKDRAAQDLADELEAAEV